MSSEEVAQKAEATDGAVDFGYSIQVRYVQLVFTRRNPFTKCSLIFNTTMQDLKRVMEVFSISQRPARTQEEALQKSYQFWNTQPVPKMGTHSAANVSLLS